MRNRNYRPDKVFTNQFAIIGIAIISPFWIVFKIGEYFLNKKEKKGGNNDESI